MEGAPYTPESTTDKTDDKSETAGSKKKDKSATAHDMAKTIFKAEEAAPQKETTLWDRLTGEKEPRTNDTDESSPAEDAVSLAEATYEHITDRQAQVQEELQQTDPQTVEAVIAASDATLLELTRQQFELTDDPATISPIELFDTAYAQASEDVSRAVTQTGAEAPHQAESPEPLAAAGGGGENIPPQPPVIETRPPAPDDEPPPRTQPEATPQAAITAQSAAETPISDPNAWYATDYAYRRGRSDGLFTGGVVGFLYGRHRGRKNAEKRFKPIKARLERQLNHITEKLSRREQDIRTLAEQKLAQAPQPVRYAAVAEQLTPAAHRVIPEQRHQPETGPVIAQPAEFIPVPQPRAEAALATPSPAELAVSRSEYAGIVPFNTSEQMSSQELKAIAEKVIIDHVSVKSMYEAQQFDEKGLRRIITEFLRGGDVQRAITNEVIQKDKAFELDPRLRHQASDSATGGGTGTITAQYRDLPAESTSKVKQLSSQAKRLPELSQTALRDLKKRQVLSVAAVTLAVILAIILAFVITS